MGERRRLPSPARALALAALALAALIVAACARPRSSYPRPDFARSAAVFAPDAGVPLPVLQVPRLDLDRGISVAGAFVSRRSAQDVEVTILFEDEAHPIGLLDRVYRAIRWRKHHRVMDIETIHYRGGLAAIDLDDVYAGAQRFDVTVARHENGVFPRAEFELRGGRPVLYVNTWNHLFGPRPTNPDLEQVAVADYPVYAGSRADCEALFEAVYEGRAPTGSAVPQSHP